MCFWFASCAVYDRARSGSPRIVDCSSRDVVAQDVSVMGAKSLSKFVVLSDFVHFRIWSKLLVIADFFIYTIAAVVLCRCRGLQFCVYRTRRVITNIIANDRYRCAYSSNILSHFLPVREDSHSQGWREINTDNFLKPENGFFFFLKIVEFYKIY